MSFLEDAKAAWKDLEMPELFLRCCKCAAAAMAMKGYPIVVGTVNLDNYCGMGKFELTHFWNYDPESGKEFDITAVHLNPYLSPARRLQDIAVWEEGRSLVHHAQRKGLESCEMY